MKLPLAFLPLGLLLGALLAARADQASRTLDVTWIDSEGGGSTLLVTPAGESVLIDTGNPGGRDAARIVAAARAAGLTRLDHVIITHWHIDHFGGAAEVAQQLPIGTLYHREIPSGHPDGKVAATFLTQVKPFREINARRVILRAGTMVPLRAGEVPLELRCLAADQAFVAAPAGAPVNPGAGSFPSRPADTSDNANSAVFLLRFGPFRMFDGGDLTWNTEERLISPVNLPGPVDVYQTNHHGLEVSNHPLLVRSLAPAVVVMNNGPRKGGQAGAFAAIRALGPSTALYQVHHSLNVPAADNAPAEFVANADEAVPADRCLAHVVTMSVAPDGRSYTVAVPSRAHRRTYATRP